MSEVLFICFFGPISKNIACYNLSVTIHRKEKLIALITGTMRHEDQNYGLANVSNIIFAIKPK